MSNVPYACKLFWTHPIELLGDVGHVESDFVPFGHSVSVGARQVHGLRRTYHMLKNHFGHTQENSQVMWVMWNLISISLEIVLVSMQDSGSVSRQTYHKLRIHFRRTRWYSQVTRLKWKLHLFYLEIVLILTQDRCMVYAERTICLEVVLDTPDRTPR